MIPFQLAFEAAWERALGALRSDQDTDMAVQQEAVEAVMEFFTDLAEIEVVPPRGSSARKLHCKGKEAIRGWVRWCLERNYNIEQTRDYRRAGEKTVWWMLATAGHFETPSRGLIQIVKGRAEAVIRREKIESFSFYPLTLETIEKQKSEKPY